MREAVIAESRARERGPTRTHTANAGMARVYRLERFGSADGVMLHEEQLPAPDPHEILVRVRAASLNRRDLMILHQEYPLPPVLGIVPVSDGAGEVAAVGRDVTRFEVGDRVTGSYFPRWRDAQLGDDQLDQLGCTLDGMLAEYILLHEQWATPLPADLSWREAATLTCGGLTAWNALTSGTLLPGQTVLTIGTGSVSTFAVQFGRLMGLHVIAVTSHGDKAERLTALGADDVIDSAATPEWGSRVRDLTGGTGVDLVVETRGPDTIEQSLIASARHGQIVLLITENRHARDIVIPGNLYARRLTTIRRIFVGNRASLERMVAAISRAKLRPVIDRSFAFTAARDAYAYLEAGDVFGNVVIDGAD
jgi:NADPH:quinone reductase-like Zn-dependent oxidoreductase